MGRPLQEYIEGNKVYACKRCGMHLTNQDSLVSKDFTGGTGRAFLFDRGVNVHHGTDEKKEMRTGWHVVQDTMCNGCCQVIGWRYVKAFEESQKYKEGKIIIEKAFIMKVKWNK